MITKFWDEIIKKLDNNIVVMCWDLFNNHIDDLANVCKRVDNNYFFMYSPKEIRFASQIQEELKHVVDYITSGKARKEGVNKKDIDNFIIWKEEQTGVYKLTLESDKKIKEKFGLTKKNLQKVCYGKIVS